MNTQSHAIINLYLIRRIWGDRFESIKNCNFVIVTGSVLPDIPMFIFFIYYTLIESAPQSDIWDKLYFKDHWQVFFDLFNSFPVFSMILVFSLVFTKPRIFLFSLSCMMHFIGDFFLHQNDAHAHFFPLSDYRFISPVSYWDPGGYGILVSWIENILVLGATVLVWRYCRTATGKSLLVLANIFSFGGYLLWKFVFVYL